MSTSSSGSILARQSHQQWCPWQSLWAHLCIPYSTYDGLDTRIGWRMAAFQNTCKVNWPHGTETKVVPNFVTKTSALKMDYINWESLADNKAAWKQELACSLKKGNSPSKKSLKRNAGGRKESSLSNAHRNDDSVLHANAETDTA